MRTSAFLPALLIAAQSSAQSASFTLQLTSENGGADTRATWSYTGSPTIAPYAPLDGGLIAFGFSLGSGSFSNARYTVSGTSGIAYTSAIASVTGLNTGLTLTNTTTNESASVTSVDFYQVTPSFVNIALMFDGDVHANLGESMVISGPTSGYFLLGSAYSNFQTGTWTYDSYNYVNFDAVLIVGPTAPVPEPSTYGLALGGLALVAVAARRRNKPKA